MGSDECFVEERVRDYTKDTVLIVKQCSNCGNAFDFTLSAKGQESEKHFVIPNYCSNCGRKVIKDG